MNLRSILYACLFLASATPGLLAVDCQLTNASADSVWIFVSAGTSAGALQIRGFDEQAPGAFQRMPPDGVLLESGAGLLFRVEDADIPVNGHFTRLSIQLAGEEDEPCLLLHRVLPGTGEASVNLTPIRSGNRVPRVIRDDQGVDGVPLFFFDGIFDLDPAPGRPPREAKAPSDGSRLSALELQKKAITQAAAGSRPWTYRVPPPKVNGFMTSPTVRKDGPPPAGDPLPARISGCVIL